MKEKSKGDDFEHKSIQSKLLAGVSGYLSKPIMYETKTIMEATMNFSEQCKIGGQCTKPHQRAGLSSKENQGRCHRGTKNFTEGKSCESSDVDGHRI